MGVPKGKDNFKVSRDRRQKAACEVLSVELQKARRRKIPYPTKAMLVSDMAERTKMHRTTLLRNPTYHRMPLGYLITQTGASTFVSDHEASPEVLRAKLIDAQVDLSHLRYQNDSIRREAAVKVKNVEEGILILSESTVQVAFADTVCALRTVLDRVNFDGEVFEVDMVQCEIRDLAAAPGRRVIFSGKRLRPFIAALRRLQEQEE